MASFFAIIWTIWKERNWRCFEGKSLNLESIIDSSCVVVTSWVSILSEFWGLHIDYCAELERDRLTLREAFLLFLF